VSLIYFLDVSVDGWSVGVPEKSSNFCGNVLVVIGLLDA